MYNVKMSCGRGHFKSRAFLWLVSFYHYFVRKRCLSHVLGLEHFKILSNFFSREARLLRLGSYRPNHVLCGVLSPLLTLRSIKISIMKTEQQIMILNRLKPTIIKTQKAPAEKDKHLYSRRTKLNFHGCN